MTDLPVKDSSAIRLPWPFMLAALVAFAALYLDGNSFIAIPFLAALLIATYFTRWRLPANRVFVWTVRIALWTVLILLSPKRHREGFNPLIEPDYVHLFGY